MIPHRILFTGATGNMGAATLAALLSCDHQAVAFRGLQLQARGEDAYAPSQWDDQHGETFEMSINLLLRGGHWRPRLVFDQGRYAAIADQSAFFRQVWI